MAQFTQWRVLCRARQGPHGGGTYYLLLLKAVVQMFSPKSVQLDESSGKQRSGVAGIQHVFGASTLNAAFLSRVFSRIVRSSSCNYTHRPSNYFVHRFPISFLSCFGSIAYIHQICSSMLVLVLVLVLQEPVEASSVPKKRRSFTVSQSWLEAAAQVRSPSLPPVLFVGPNSSCYFYSSDICCLCEWLGWRGVGVELVCFFF